MMPYFCCTEQRRDLVRQHAMLNGIDFLEVDDNPTLPNDQRQRQLAIQLIKPLAGSLTPDNVQLEGGESVRGIRVLNVAVAGARLTIDVDRPGDFSTYTLRLVAGIGSDQPPNQFDPLLSAVEFSFKVNCPSDFDCRDDQSCPPEVWRSPDINYLAKDFNSFRQVMLDRLRAQVPDWRETSVADLLHTLIDWKAYIADYQSYQQDAQATEAYLFMARRRTSIRRHARLVDYFMHDGCSARVWVQVRVDPAVGAATAVPLPAGTRVLTRLGDLPPRLQPDTPELRAALDANPEVFETLHNATLFAAHNDIALYTWGDERCCLPRGATRATLRGHYPNLHEGDVLVLEEIAGAETGNPADADPAHRYAVRLVEVRQADDPITTPPTPVTEIRWHLDDALAGPFCVSALIAAEQSGVAAQVRTIGMARGNLVLADHGQRLAPEAIGMVPSPRLAYVRPGAGCEDEPSSPAHVPVRFRPRLGRGPLTQAVPYRPMLFHLEFDQRVADELDAGRVPAVIGGGLARQRILSGPLGVEQRAIDIWILRNRGLVYVVQREPIPDALGNAIDSLAVYDYPASSSALRVASSEALPALTLTSMAGAVVRTWQPRRDLLNSGADALDVVAEVEDGGIATLRFGDEKFGRRPDGGEAFTAQYRIGVGPAGNIGADTLRHIVSNQTALVGVCNPLPASGGVAPEASEAVRQAAPQAYRRQERAVTPDDYAEVALRHPAVQRAAATFRWTGSWYTIFLTVDRFGGLPVDAEFERELRAFMDHYRMAGYDLEIDTPRYVPLEIALEVCVLPDYFRSAVRRELVERFSGRTLPNGRRGVFHPDNFTFGQTVYLSPLYAEAMAIAGVQSARFTAFQRQGQPNTSGLADGKIALGRLEIAQVEQNPSFPQRGVFRLVVSGGK